MIDIKKQKFRVILLLTFSIQIGFILSCNNDKDNNHIQNVSSICNIKSLPQLPDVTITSVSQETKPVPHCKVAGVIGPEIHFELLLPEKWNGKFVFGGGGGFVGSVVILLRAYIVPCKLAMLRWAPIRVIKPIL